MGTQLSISNLAQLTALSIELNELNDNLIYSVSKCDKLKHLELATWVKQACTITKTGFMILARMDLYYLKMGPRSFFTEDMVAILKNKMEPRFRQLVLMSSDHL